MELFFTAVALVLVGAAYFTVQHFRSPSAQCRRQISDWMAGFETATPIEQYEMAELLLHQSAELAAQMGVTISLEQVLAEDDDPVVLIRNWQALLPTAFPGHALPNTPARTVGALLLIRQLQPERFEQLLGQRVAS